MEPDGAGRAVWRPAALATGAGLAGFVVGTAAESVIIRAVQGNRSELEWLSDAVVSMAGAGITYLWLHLKASRIHVFTLQQEQLAIDEQLRLAAEIQRGLLPDVPQATPGFRWAARMTPASRIGGDIYDFFQPTDGTVLAIVADVSGKGIPAALSQILGASLERLRGGSSPAEICDDLLRAAAAGPGPAAVPDWHDDRTVFASAVEPPV